MSIHNHENQDSRGQKQGKKREFADFGLRGSGCRMNLLLENLFGDRGNLHSGGRLLFSGHRLPKTHVTKRIIHLRYSGKGLVESFAAFEKNTHIEVFKIIMAGLFVFGKDLIQFGQLLF